MKIRNANGFGSITKLSGNRRNKFMVRKTDHIDSATGRQVMKVLGYFPKYSDAMAFLLAYNEGKTVLGITDTPLTFKRLYDDFVQEKYIKYDKPIDRKYSSSYSRCEKLYERNFKSITLQELVEIMDAAPTPHTKKYLKTLFIQLYNYAIKYDYVDKNLGERLDNVTIPKSELHHPFSEDEIRKLWKLKHEYCARLWLIYIYTGLRPSELSHIEKQDVHLSESYMVGGMKNETSKNRLIPIADCIRPFVKELYNNTEHYLVPAENKDAPYNEKKLREMLEAFCESNKFSKHLPHDGRHTCATRLDNQGTNLIVTQRILGHSSRSITGKVYIHKTVSEMLEAVNSLPAY